MGFGATLRMKNNIKYNQDQASIMLKFSGIMYLTLLQIQTYFQPSLGSYDNNKCKPVGEINFSDVSLY